MTERPRAPRPRDPGRPGPCALLWSVIRARVGLRTWVRCARTGRLFGPYGTAVGEQRAAAERLASLAIAELARAEEAGLIARVHQERGRGGHGGSGQVPESRVRG